jgi:hypothetical protein
MCLASTLFTVSCALNAAAASAASPPPSWSVSVSVTAKETFDSNVFLQDHGDLAKCDSWVTSFLPSLGATYRAGPELKAVLSYAPEIAYYHDERSEDYVAHRFAANLDGKVGDTAWEWSNGVVWTDGSRLGPRFTGGGDIPAIGGIALRDRRDATVFRHSGKLTRTLGKGFVRPVFTTYFHNFQTEHHRTTEPGFAGYENYVDRYDVSGGLDGGLEVAGKTWLVLGYRYGHQKQKRNQFQAASPYTNDYHRFLAGVEGTPAAWLKLSVLAGPDVRDFGSATPAGFDRDEFLWFIDASATLTPTKEDTVTLAARRYEQPAFSSHSVYEDIVYDCTYRHKLSSQLTVGAGLRLYGGDWQAPVNREDWILTPSFLLAYTHDSRLSGELTYTHDRVDSKVANTAGREYTRSLWSLSMKYSF